MLDIPLDTSRVLDCGSLHAENQTSANLRLGTARENTLKIWPITSIYLSQFQQNFCGIHMKGQLLYFP